MPKSFLVKRKCCKETSEEIPQVLEEEGHPWGKHANQSTTDDIKAQETPVIIFSKADLEEEKPDHSTNAIPRQREEEFKRQCFNNMFSENEMTFKRDRAEYAEIMANYNLLRYVQGQRELLRRVPFLHHETEAPAMYEFSPQSPSSSVESPPSPASCGSVDVSRDELEPPAFRLIRQNPYLCANDNSSQSEDESSWGRSPCPSPVYPYQTVNKLMGNNSLRVDLKTKQHTCKDCGKSFVRASSLSNHKLIHKNVKAFHCDECGMSFLRKSDLGKHTVTHTGLKPYQCDICFKCFSQSSNMLTHRRRHTGTRPYSCRHCGKSFYRKVDVRRHSRIHQ